MLKQRLHFLRFSQFGTELLAVRGIGREDGAIQRACPGRKVKELRVGWQPRAHMEEDAHLQREQLGTQTCDLRVHATAHE